MEPVNKIVVLCCLLAVSAAGFLGFQLHSRQQSVERLSVEIKNVRTQLAEIQADANSKGTANTELDNKLKELTILLVKSKSDLALAQEKAKSFDETIETEKAVKVAKEKELREAMKQVPPPTVTVTTTPSGGEVKTLTFDKLIGRTGNVVASKAEFLSIDGRKVFFKYERGGGSLDVDALHLGVLAHLGIDPDAAKQLQTKLDVQREREENLRLQAAAQRIAFYEKLKNERREADAKIAAEKAKELASQAEAARQARAAENERMQAEAAKTQAEAAILNANRPPGYDYYGGPPSVTTRLRSQ